MVGNCYFPDIRKTDIRKEARQYIKVLSQDTMESEINNQISSMLHHAGTMADIGAEIPQLIRWPRILRPVGRLILRVILYLSRFVIYQQRQFNWAIIHLVGTQKLKSDESIVKEIAVLRREQLRQNSLIMAQAMKIEYLERQLGITVSTSAPDVEFENVAGKIDR